MSKQPRKFAIVEAQKIAVWGVIITALFGLLGVTINAIANYESSMSPIYATQTAEARLTEMALSFTRTPTPISSPAFTPTVGFTETPAPTSTPPEPALPDGYMIYDNFDVSPTSGWDTTDDSTLCKRELVEGGLKIECTGSATEHVGFDLFPSDLSARKAQGIAMAFYTLPVQANYTQWGKFQLQMIFGSDCTTFNKVYQISIRPTELSFLDYASGWTLLNSPVPKMTITPEQPQVVRIEYSSIQTDFYVNDVSVLSLPLPPTTPSSCLSFQSNDNNKMTPNGYRGMVLLWFAIKK